MMLVTRPSLTLWDTNVQLDTSHKFLGVLLDQELHWREKVEQVVAKATKWSLGACRLANLAMGILPWQMRQLYQVVAMPSFTYAADIWFMPILRCAWGGKSRGAAGAARQ